MRYVFFSLLWVVALGVLPDTIIAATEFPRLDLMDGRTLKDVTVRSYDAETDKVLLLSEGKAYSIPARLVPPPFAASSGSAVRDPAHRFQW